MSIDSAPTVAGLRPRSELSLENGNQRKLLKLLSKLRKKAGKVRDLDVQIAFLKELGFRTGTTIARNCWNGWRPSRRGARRNLAKSLDTATVQELRKRLRRVHSETQLDGVDPLQLARKRLPNPGATPLSEKMLHACRIEAKRARYLAELAADTPEGKDFVEQLKTAQDAIGEWHDIMKLKEQGGADVRRRARLPAGGGTAKHQPREIPSRKCRAAHGHRRAYGIEKDGVPRPIKNSLSLHLEQSAVA